MPRAEATSKMKELRLELKKILRQRNEFQKQQTKVRHPIPDIEGQTVLVLLLTGRKDLAVDYANHWQKQQLQKSRAIPAFITEDLVDTWKANWKTSPILTSAMQDLDHPWRSAVDVFLMESLIFEEIVAQNRKGLVVPSNTVVAMLVRKWNYRPMPESVQTTLDKLTQNKNCFKKRWCYQFRKRWDLHITQFHARSALPSLEIKFRVPRPEHIFWIENKNKQIFRLFAKCTSSLKRD
jgi:hypothetical protein